MRARRLAVSFALAAATAAAQEPASPRARDLGIPFEFGTPGRLDSITDVAGVEVGHVTLVDGALGGRAGPGRGCGC